jgi:nucleoside phosphorylase/tetratricopeptide (TPR) repeat protein
MVRREGALGQADTERPQVDILVVTVTETESRAVLSAFGAVANYKPKPVTVSQAYHDLGIVNDVRVAMVRSEMGSGTPGASSEVVRKAIADFNPSMVIMVGIAFGVDPAKEHIGDVLVSQQLSLYGPQRRGTRPDGTAYSIARGPRVPAASLPLSIMRAAELSWKKRAEVRFGLMLSGPVLVDNRDFREHLKALEPEAIGGEMEGEGLYLAAQDAKVDWIIVKGICDWADGNKAKNKLASQRLAARNAAAFVVHALRYMPTSTHEHNSSGQAGDKRQIGNRLSKRPDTPDSGGQARSGWSALDLDIDPSPVRRALTQQLRDYVLRRNTREAIVVTGTNGSGSTAFAAHALSTIDVPTFPISLDELVRGPLWRESAQEVALLRYLANIVGSQMPAFDREWRRYEKCCKAAGRLRTMVDQSGYANVYQSLRSLVRDGDQAPRESNRLQILRRALKSSDDIDLVLRPERHLLAALLQDLNAARATQMVLHFHDIERVPETLLIWLIHELINLDAPSLHLRIVVSLEARPNAFPLLRGGRPGLRVVHVPAASTSEVIEYVGNNSIVAHSKVFSGDVIAMLSRGSYDVAEFLRRRPYLTARLTTLERAGGGRGAATAAEAWTLLAVAYDVTPLVISQYLHLAEKDAIAIADEIPDDVDGGRRLPYRIAAAAIGASAPSTIEKACTFLWNHLKGVSSNRDGAPASTADVALAFHTAWSFDNFSEIDSCLLRNFRTSLSICSNLRDALSRLLLIAPIKIQTSQQIAARLAVIDTIEKGWVDEESVVQFFQNIAANPNDFDREQRAIAYYQLGHSYFSSGQYDLAGAALEYSVELNSRNYSAWSLLGLVLDLNKDHRRAVIALNEAITLNGGYEFAHYNLAVVKERHGDLVEAAEEYAIAMKNEPTFYEAAYNLSNTLLKLRLIKEAAEVATFTGAIDHEMRVEPIFNIATAAAEFGDFGAAIKLFKFCLNERAESRTAYNLGLAYASNRQRQSAMEFLKIAQRLASNEGDEEIARSAARSCAELKAGRMDGWPAHAPRDLPPPGRVISLREKLDELFESLRHNGRMRKGAESIRRAVAKLRVTTRVADASARPAEPLDARGAARTARTSGAKAEGMAYDMVQKGRINSKKRRLEVTCVRRARTDLSDRAQPCYARLPSYGGG